MRPAVPHVLVARRGNKIKRAGEFKRDGDFLLATAGISALTPVERGLLSTMRAVWESISLSAFFPGTAIELRS